MTERKSLEMELEKLTEEDGSFVSSDGGVINVESVGNPFIVKLAEMSGSSNNSSHQVQMEVKIKEYARELKERLGVAATWYVVGEAAYDTGEAIHGYEQRLKFVPVQLYESSLFQHDLST
jgi:Flp pilus assembly secretin CpaC